LFYNQQIEPDPAIVFLAMAESDSMKINFLLLAVLKFDYLNALLLLLQ
jgi:hypothetical protein